MKPLVYIIPAIIIIITGYFYGKSTNKETQDYAKVEPIIVKPQEQENNPVIDTIENIQLAKDKDIQQGSAKSFQEMIDSPDKLYSAQESIGNLLDTNPQEISIEQVELYSSQVIYIIERSDLDKEDIFELVRDLNSLNSTDFKEDIFEYLVQKGIIKDSDLTTILDEGNN